MPSNLARTIVVLVAAGGLVMGAVVGLAAWVLPETLAGTDPLGAPQDTVHATGSTLLTVGQPDPDAALQGGRVQVTGDRELVVEFDPSESVFSEDVRYVLEGDDVSLRLDRGQESGIYVDQANIDGLNLFLDPGECVFQQTAGSDRTGLATLDISCEGISDIQGNNMVSVAGFVYLPLNFVNPDDYPTGGTVSVAGANEATFELPGAFWYIIAEGTFSAENSDGGVTHSFLAYEYEEHEDGTVAPSTGLTFAVDETGIPSVISVSIGPSTPLEIEPGACPGQVTELSRVAPDTEYVEVTVNCETTTIAREPVTITADLRVQRVTDDPAIYFDH